MSLAQFVAARGYGMIACGEHLGVFVAPVAHIRRCPAGWVFMPSEEATAERVQEAIDVATAGRSVWPEAEPSERKGRKR